MSPGEIEGYLRQLGKRKDLNEKERQALHLASQAVHIVVEVNKFFVKKSDPNTGWSG